MGAPASKDKQKISREERDRIVRLKRRFDNRITTARFGKESLDGGDYAGAIQRWTEYMNTVAETKNLKDYTELRISHFDPKRDMTEMLMMSHVFFEMARIYDAIPKFHDDSKKCLDLFVHFSANQPYQVVNSELVRKFLKRNAFKHPEAFMKAYQQIFVQSKKCYVVTFCYGSDHEITQQFRLFKDWLLESPSGQTLVRRYYNYSSTAVLRWEHSKLMHLLARFILRPALLLFSKVVLPLIIK